MSPRFPFWTSQHSLPVLVAYNGVRSIGTNIRVDSEGQERGTSSPGSGSHRVFIATITRDPSSVDTSRYKVGAKKVGMLYEDCAVELVHRLESANSVSGSTRQARDALHQR
ncbi:hypothetical protein IF1G_09978 [Cordyceps javanica]|uniref:Uncharacterized protein n=1 Tax=Cordyceps javanica TaxID=43265 RepID=A0A545UPX1_9HYPO|nr:hypothetical protein IF1G_09978 [Cordyceps javanica]